MFFSHRPLHHLIVGGVFERFPKLKFVDHRAGLRVDPRVCCRCSTAFHAQMPSGRIGEIKFTPTTRCCR